MILLSILRLLCRSSHEERGLKCYCLHLSLMPWRRSSHEERGLKYDKLLAVPGLLVAPRMRSVD